MTKPAVDFELTCSDCVTGMAQLESGSVDLVVTSPPYNLGIKYQSYQDDLQREAYLAWSLEWAAEVKRVLKDDGSFFLNVGAAPSNPLLPYELITALTKDLFQLQNTIHWIKSISIDEEEGVISRGHFKPINSGRFVNDCHEFVFHLTKTGRTPIDRKAVGVPYVHKSNIDRWGHTEGADVRCRGNTWFIPYKTIRDRAAERPHPATFPPALAAQCIRLHGIERTKVMLEPFLGIGSAAQAARDCGVPRFIGFDIDAGYVETARQRLG